MLREAMLYLGTNVPSDQGNNISTHSMLVSNYTQNQLSNTHLRSCACCAKLVCLSDYHKDTTIHDCTPTCLVIFMHVVFA